MHSHAYTCMHSDAISPLSRCLAHTHAHAHAPADARAQGENKAELDFNAVQRGDAEMEQKTNRVIRACVEMGAKNPIVAIHDQGAGA